MTISKKTLRAIAVLHLPRTVPGVLALAAAVVKAIKSSRRYFPSPDPPLAVVIKAIDELRLAHQAAQLRTVGAVGTRDEKQATLVALLGSVCAHVQRTADLDPPTAGRSSAARGWRCGRPGNSSRGASTPSSGPSRGQSSS